jgi:hypothetical protein
MNKSFSTCIQHEHKQVLTGPKATILCFTGCYSTTVSSYLKKTVICPQMVVLPIKSGMTTLCRLKGR